LVDEPEAPLTRAAVALVVGGALAGASRTGLVANHGGLAEALLLGGALFIAAGLIATGRVLLAHWKDRAR
jgi:high-affinity Fe2+/Pb2+ permease